jgi:hypothetical protein
MSRDLKFSKLYFLWVDVFVRNDQSACCQRSQRRSIVQNLHVVVVGCFFGIFSAGWLFMNNMEQERKKERKKERKFIYLLHAKNK